MRIKTDTFQWQPIATAPENQPICLEVTGRAGEVYTLPFPCERKGGEFFTEKGTRLQVTPTKWKSHQARKVSLNPKYMKSNAANAEDRTLRARPRDDA